MCRYVGDTGWGVVSKSTCRVYFTQDGVLDTISIWFFSGEVARSLPAGGPGGGGGEVGRRAGVAGGMMDAAWVAGRPAVGWWTSPSLWLEHSPFVFGANGGTGLGRWRAARCSHSSRAVVIWN